MLVFKKGLKMIFAKLDYILINTNDLKRFYDSLPTDILLDEPANQAAGWTMVELLDFLGKEKAAEELANYILNNIDNSLD